MIRVAILGATGSIGRSTLRVLDRHPERFEVVALSARRRVEELAELALRYRPEVAVIADPDALAAHGSDLPDGDWRGGSGEVAALAERDDVDVVVNAVVGSAGLDPTLRALRSGKRFDLYLQYSRS